jgi:MHS family proline/betaine transporter-like MFS transporter
MKHKLLKIIFANLTGTALEIYDIAIYGFFAPVIAVIFFPTSNKTSALINTLAIFLATYIVRPFGAIFFGYIGDTAGRKKPLVITVTLISLGTFCIGLLPPASQIGMLAPLLLLLCRVIQGFSFSGEYVGAFIFLTEQAAPRHKAFFASWPAVGGTLGLLIASLFSYLITHFCTQQQLYAWGWRLPFLFSIIGGALSLYFRFKVVEVIPFKKTLLTTTPLLHVLRLQKKPLFIILSLSCFYMAGCYLLFMWSTTVLTLLAKMSLATALGINSIALIIQSIQIPLISALADKYSRKPFLLLGIIGTLAGIYPYYYILQNGSLFAIFAAQITICMLMSCFTSIMSVTVAELVPAATRYTCVGLAYNIGAMLAGGTSSVIAIYLIKLPHGIEYLSLYFAFWGLLAWIALQNLDSNAVYANLAGENRIAPAST